MLLSNIIVSYQILTVTEIIYIFQYLDLLILLLKAWTFVFCKLTVVTVSRLK